MGLLCSKKLSGLFRRITSKNNGDFYCLNCLHPFRTKNKLELHKKVCENKDFCNVVMPSKAPFVIYPDLECIIEKIDECKNNPESSAKTKLSEHIPSGVSMSTLPLFRK